ncbi:BMP family ABC transporter substrate-binding protein [Elioraea sp.]|uniref:BMP family ABC transporter substrate-binding protein n=1 Tax=Elioraea sp. TaxID=2185103 RepID=UPI0025C42D33|nr:BMP family ABC transporter substrate-binding protein [Elioraea sp.]
MTFRVAGVLFGPRGLGGFNAAGERGLLAASDETDAALTIHWVEERGAREATLASLCGAGYDLIVCHGGQAEAALNAVAPRFPSQAIAATQCRAVPDHVARYEVLQEESAFLAGAFAGWFSRTGTVAHLSGEPVAPGLRGRAAFVAGLRHAAQDARFLTRFTGDQHDPAAAFVAVQEFADAGADLLFAMLDGGREGAIAACRARGLRQIGNVRDWTTDGPVFAASAVADGAWACAEPIRDFAAGRFTPGLRRIAGLAEQRVVRLALAGDVPRDITRRVEALADAMRASEVDVPEAWDEDDAVLARAAQ